MDSILKNLEDRSNSTDDEGFQEIYEEVESNWKIYKKELEEPTAKHGTDTENFEEIIEDGLTPGAENDSKTGESSEHEDVCFSTSYPIALRYAELTEANEYLKSSSLEQASIGSLESPMVVEIPVQNIDSLKVDKRNTSAVRELLGADINGYQAAMVSEVCKKGPESENPLREFIDYDEDGIISEAVAGKQKAQDVAYSLLNGEKIDPENLREYDFFDNLDQNELNASFLNEICTDRASAEDMTLYVPQSELKKYRQKVEEKNFDVRVGSLEARALVHEANMEDEYEENGCISYTRPENGEYGVRVFNSNEDQIAHESSDEIIHISRLDGEKIYPKE